MSSSTTVSMVVCAGPHQFDLVRNLGLRKGFPSGGPRSKPPFRITRLFHSHRPRFCTSRGWRNGQEPKPRATAERSLVRRGCWQCRAAAAVLCSRESVEKTGSMLPEWGKGWAYRVITLLANYYHSLVRWQKSHNEINENVLWGPTVHVEFIIKSMLHQYFKYIYKMLHI